MIKCVVFCEGTRFGDLWSVYYVSGYARDFKGEAPKEVKKFIEAREPTIDKINQHGKRYIRWE